MEGLDKAIQDAQPAQTFDFIDPHEVLDGEEKKNVLIIYTGGTMGMKPDEDGSLAPVPGYLVQVLKEMPEMHRPEMPSYTIIEYDPIIDR